MYSRVILLDEAQELFNHLNKIAGEQQEKEGNKLR